MCNFNSNDDVEEIQKFKLDFSKKVKKTLYNV